MYQNAKDAEDGGPGRDRDAAAALAHLGLGSLLGGFERKRIVRVFKSFGTRTGF
jgi:hypothetical protein